MALIVEDGSIVENADTYVTRADAIAYALRRGVVLPDTEATDIQIIKAMDYLAMFDTKWLGQQVNPATQYLAWPRSGVFIGFSHVAFPSDDIPNQLIKAQCELVLQVNAGIDLMPTVSASAAFVKREKVDVIETEYSEAIALALLNELPNMPLVDAYLSPLLDQGGGIRIRTLRI